MRTTKEASSWILRTSCNLLLDNIFDKGKHLLLYTICIEKVDIKNFKQVITCNAPVLQKHEAMFFTCEMSYYANKEFFSVIASRFRFIACLKFYNCLIKFSLSVITKLSMKSIFTACTWYHFCCHSYSLFAFSPHIKRNFHRNVTFLENKIICS